MYQFSQEFVPRLSYVPLRRSYRVKVCKRTPRHHLTPGILLPPDFHLGSRLEARSQYKR